MEGSLSGAKAPGWAWEKGLGLSQLHLEMFDVLEKFSINIPHFLNEEILLVEAEVEKRK